jgi:chromosomal replication initiator protein
MQPGSLVPDGQFSFGQDAESASELILQELAGRIGEQQFSQWFQDKARCQMLADEFVVAVASPFLMQWLQKKFSRSLSQAAQTVLGGSARVRIVVDGPASDVVHAVATKRVAPAEPSQPPSSHSKLPRPATSAASKTTDLTVLPQAIATAVESPKATAKSAVPSRRFADLSDFVAGPGTELAMTAVGQVCRAPGTQLNPLCLHGGVGLGKTHLLEGIYRQVRRIHAQAQVMYLTAENFANFFTSALREHKLPSFRQRFRSVDVLLIDDVHFLDAKFGIQEEFLHTVKQLDSLGRQLVVTVDRHPRLLTKMTEELKTRFLAGMVCRLESPDLATRREIVNRKAAGLDADFTGDSLAFVAERFTQNVRELEGALNCLATYHAMSGQRVTATVARNVLAELERDCIRVVRMADIEQAVASLFGLGADELRSEHRSRAISQPRMLAMYLARKHTRSAYAEIGRYFGGRNHSTAIAAERKIAQDIQQQATIKIASQSWTLREVLETLDQQLCAC